MRLLFIVPYAPTPIRTRPYFILNHLGARGHEITLATLYSSMDERESLNRWHALGVKVIAAPLPRTRSLWNVARTLPTTTPLQAVFCWQPILAHQLTELVAQDSFDACHVEHLRGALYGRHVQRTCAQAGKPLRIVWDSVDCITTLWKQTAAFSHSRASRLAARVELERTRRFEPEMAGAFDVTTVVTDPERSSLLSLASSSARANLENRLYTVPNGVDANFFHPEGSERDPATVLFSGKMSYHANLTAAFVLLDEIMPRVWQKIPAARVLIVGQGPSPGLLKRARLDPDRIRVTGAVPDIRPFLQTATVACAPIVYGAGVQNKILEAMAMELPVVSSEHAARALKVQNERDLLIGTDGDSISEQLVRALQQQDLRARLAQNANVFVKTHHRWQASVETLESFYQHRDH